MMQLGSDIGVWKINQGSLHLGLMAGYGDFENTSTSRATHLKAKSKSKGYNVGVYGSWFANEETNQGLYIDTWSQFGWFRNEINGAAQRKNKKYNSQVWSNSIEAGYAVSLFSGSTYGVMMTPQTQLTYHNYDMDNQRDANSTKITNNKASGLVSRVGSRLHAYGLKSERLVQPYIEMNWINTTAKNQLDFNGVTLKDGMPRNRGEAKIGLQGNITERLNIGAEYGEQWGENNFNQYQAQLNINYKW